jgi:hypothetical protein
MLAARLSSGCHQGERAMRLTFTAGLIRAVMLGLPALSMLVAPALTAQEQAPAALPAASRPAPTQATPSLGAPASPAALQTLPAPASQTPPPATTAPPATELAAKPHPFSSAAARRDAWKSLSDGLEEKDSDRRVQAILALGTIGTNPMAVRLVESALQDKNSLVRQAAATTLGKMKARSSIPKLRTAMDDESAIVSFAAATALWNMGDKSGQDIFVEVMEGDRKVAQGTVSQGLHTAHEKLRDPGALAELGASMAAGAFLGPAGMGVTVVADLAKDKGAPARAACARLLAQDMDADSRSALEDALNDKSWVVRATAAEALATGRSRSSLPKVASLLDDDRSEVRYSAAAAVIRLTPAL